MYKIFSVLLSCLKDGHQTALKIFRLLVPIIIFVKILDESGIIPYLAMPMKPVMNLMGLPAEVCLAWLASMLVNLYSGLIVLVSLVGTIPDLTVAQVTVFGVAILIAHSLIMEVQIAGQCGVKMPFQFFLRLVASLIAAISLHLLLDGLGLLQEKALILFSSEPSKTISEWILAQIILLAKMYVIICLVMLLQVILDTFHISDFVGKILAPLLRILGISSKAVSIVLIGFTMGILYGSGVLIRSTQHNQLTKRDALCSISLLGLSHSLIEDTFVVMLFGASLWGILGYRLVFTLIFGALINRFYPYLEKYAVPQQSR